MTAAEALAAKKLRLAPIPAVDGLAPDALVQALWTALRTKFPVPGTSQDELVTVTGVRRDGDATIVTFAHLFDHDFASQYDKTESHTGTLRLGPDGDATLTEWAAA